MTETALQIISSLKIIVLGLFATLYALGGMAGTSKGIRRVGGALLLTIAIVGFSLWQNNFSFWYLLFSPLLWGGLSLGYGGDTTKEKVLRRLRVGTVLSLASLPIAIVNQAWVLLALHFVLCNLTHLVLGVLNPAKAREEETIIPTICGLFPLFMI